MNYFYTLYRRIIVALFGHLSQEFRSGLKADLERARNVAAKETQTTESALKEEFDKVHSELAALEKKHACDLTALKTLKTLLENRIDQVEQHVETLDMKKYGPKSDIRYSNRVRCGD